MLARLGQVVCNAVQLAGAELVVVEVDVDVELLVLNADEQVTEALADLRAVITSVKHLLTSPTVAEQSEYCVEAEAHVLTPASVSAGACKHWLYAVWQAETIPAWSVAPDVAAAVIPVVTQSVPLSDDVTLFITSSQTCVACAAVILLTTVLLGWLVMGPLELVPLLLLLLLHPSAKSVRIAKLTPLVPGRFLIKSLLSRRETVAKSIWARPKNDPTRPQMRRNTSSGLENIPQRTIQPAI